MTDFKVTEQADDLDFDSLIAQTGSALHYH